MKIVKWTEMILLAGTLSLGVAITTYATAEESAKEKVMEAGRDIGKNAKQMGRKVKDEVCEMVNGKMECVGQKIKHGAKNVKDEVKDKVDDIKK